MKRQLQLLIAFTIITLYCSCEIQKCCDHPLSFVFTITNSAGTSYFLQKKDIKMYILKNGQKNYQSNFPTYEFSDTSDAYTYKFFWRIDYDNQDSFKRNYFLELPGGDIDTLYLDVRKGINLPDNIFQANFNGKAVEIDDQAIKHWRIHLLKK